MAPRAGAAEDDILHLAGAAQLAGAGLAQHPAHRVRKVGFARAIGAYHAGNALVKPDLYLIGEAFKALDLQFFEYHLLFLYHTQHQFQRLLCGVLLGGFFAAALALGAARRCTVRTTVNCLLWSGPDSPVHHVFQTSSGFCCTISCRRVL